MGWEIGLESNHQLLPQCPAPVGADRGVAEVGGRDRNSRPSCSGPEEANWAITVWFFKYMYIYTGHKKQDGIGVGPCLPRGK